jgi:lysylphosphatidylglycerol synthetase-like protein (DUF2156 family)
MKDALKKPLVMLCIALITFLFGMNYYNTYQERKEILFSGFAKYHLTLFTVTGIIAGFAILVLWSALKNKELESTFINICTIIILIVLSFTLNQVSLFILGLMYLFIFVVMKLKYRKYLDKDDIEDSKKRTPEKKSKKIKMTYSNPELLSRFQKIMKISQQISKKEVASALNLTQKQLLNKLIEWSDLPFKINNEMIIVEDLGAFTSALDSQFADWEAKEESKEGKVE